MKTIQTITEEFEKKCNQEEWGGWKFVSDMLDHPDENGLYPTSKCYEELYDFVVAQKKKALTQQRDEFLNQPANQHDQEVRRQVLDELKEKVERMRKEK